MSPKTAKAPKVKRVQYPETAVVAACQAIQVDGMPQRLAAQCYGVPRSTLKDRLKGKPSLRQIHRKYLTKEEEERLATWLEESSQRGFYRTKQQVYTTVQKILEESGRTTLFKDNKPGAKWLNQFLARHSQFTMRSSRIDGKTQAAIYYRKLIPEELIDPLADALPRAATDSTVDADSTDITATDSPVEAVSTDLMDSNVAFSVDVTDCASDAISTDVKPCVVDAESAAGDVVCDGQVSIEFPNDLIVDDQKVLIQVVDGQCADSGAQNIDHDSEPPSDSSSHLHNAAVPPVYSSALPTLSYVLAPPFTSSHMSAANVVHVNSSGVFTSDPSTTASGSIPLYSSYQPDLLHTLDMLLDLAAKGGFHKLVYYRAAHDKRMELSEPEGWQFLVYYSRLRTFIGDMTRSEKERQVNIRKRQQTFCSQQLPRRLSQEKKDSLESLEVKTSNFSGFRQAGVIEKRINSVQEEKERGESEKEMSKELQAEKNKRVQGQETASQVSVSVSERQKSEPEMFTSEEWRLFEKIEKEMMMNQKRRKIDDEKKKKVPEDKESSGGREGERNDKAGNEGKHKSQTTSCKTLSFSKESEKSMKKAKGVRKSPKRKKKVSAEDTRKKLSEEREKRKQELEVKKKEREERSIQRGGKGEHGQGKVCLGMEGKENESNPNHQRVQSESLFASMTMSALTGVRPLT